MSYNLVINSKFRPFTYDEMVKPLAQYKEVYDKVEADYSTLLTQAEAWKDIANRENNPIAYDMYNRYMNDLSAVTADLSRGLNPNNRSKLSTMRQRYSSDIIPIERAYTTRKKHIDEQKQARLKDPSLRFQRDASSTSLDTYIQNPDFEYGNGISGDALTKQVSDTVSHLAKQLRDYSNGKRIDNYTKTLFQQYGLTPQEVMEAQYNPNAANNMLVKIVNTVVDNSGVNEWNDPSARQWAYDYAARGLYSGIGQSGIKEYEDKGAIMATQHQYALDKMAKQHEYNMLELQAKAANSGKSGPVNQNMLLRSITGVENKPNPNVERLKGLRPIATGEVSTTIMDKAKARMDAAEKELSKLSAKDREQVEALGKKLTKGKEPSNIGKLNAMTALQQSGKVNPEEDRIRSLYHSNKKWVDQYNEAKKEYDNEKTYINSLLDEYDYLEGNNFQRLYIAQKLMDLQEARQVAPYPISLDDTATKKVRTKLASAINSGGTLREIGKKKDIDKKDALDLLEGDKAAYFKIDLSKDELVVATIDGKDYGLKNIEPIESYAKITRKVDDYLKDFSGNSVKPNTVYVSDVAYDYILNNNTVEGLSVPKDTKPVNISEGLYGITIQANDKSPLKVIYDDYGRIVYTNTLADELSGARNRDNIFTTNAMYGINAFNSLAD